MTDDERAKKLAANVWARQSPDALVQACRRLAGRRLNGRPNWVIAMDLFGCGSTVAYELLRGGAVDPDAVTHG